MWQVRCLAKITRMKRTHGRLPAPSLLKRKCLHMESNVALLSIIFVALSFLHKLRMHDEACPRYFGQTQSGKSDL